jgi:hypothetical protein
VSEEEKFRQLAAEARADAERATDPYNKRTLLLIAQRYEMMAERAKARDDTAGDAAKFA